MALPVPGLTHDVWPEEGKDNFLVASGEFWPDLGLISGQVLLPGE